jgi:hypothetical protein
MLLLAYFALLMLAVVAGATLAWLMAGRALRQPRHLSAQGLDAQAALRRHPAGRARWGDPGSPGEDEADTVAQPLGPDDDQDFIDRLERQIRGGTDPGPAA